MKTITAIFIGIGIWILAAVAFMSSAFLSIVDDPELQGNLVLALALIPIVSFGTNAYLRKYKNSNPLKVGLIFFATAFVLDALITVPIFMKGYGVSYTDFFLSISFWLIGVEFVTISFITGKISKLSKN